MEALRLSRFFPGTSATEFLKSSRLMAAARRVYWESQPPPPRDEFDPNIEAIKRLRESGALDE